MKPKFRIIFIMAVAAFCYAMMSKPTYSTADIGHLPPETGKLVEGAKEQTEYTLYYDPAYIRIAYPNGDVPKERGVCSDVVIRAFRNVEIDLQQDVHEDMKKNFHRYPKQWGLKKPDTNIDHRRVLNLMTYFERRGKSVPISQNPIEYLPGDIVAWRLDNGLPHIGIVSDVKADDKGLFRIIHNIGSGARIENGLFDWKIIGHYRYFRK